MSTQIDLFTTVEPTFVSPAIAKLLVMRSAFVETHKWQEFHENGQLWIDGELAIVSDLSKHLYRCFDGYYDCRKCDGTGNAPYFIPKGTPVCRIGVWTKYYDNGQLAWQIDYGDGSYETLFSDKRKGQPFPLYREDGTMIVR